ncbi:hypothetical protein H920_17694 [Fukomys damarensis]|uniref:Uncharacterized protein n=1 Tax=Fukomys damarensis TaxID=885580 RepID=A0A091DDL0_FUKDA|nr:hypothetical protein H920_17694 [Fukomys damarensis]
MAEALIGGGRTRGSALSPRRTRPQRASAHANEGWDRGSESRDPEHSFDLSLSEEWRSYSKGPVSLNMPEDDREAAQRGGTQ